MSFSHIKSITFSNLDSNYVFLNHLIFNEFNIIPNKQYKFNFIKNNKITHVKTCKLKAKDHCILPQDSKHPEEACVFELKSGTYKLLYKSGQILNSKNEVLNIVKSSKGDVVLDNFNIQNNNFILEKINQFKFKISKEEMFSVWLESNNLNDVSGEIEIDLVKISSSKLNDDSSNISMLFDSSSLSNIMLNLDKNFEYVLEIYELDDVEIFNPIIKYPQGTYKVTLNTKVSSSSNENDLISSMDADKKKFDLIGDKIISLNNIAIPSNANPLNYYVMVGKIEYMLYINFNTDTYYFQPCSMAECFMSLYIPESNCTLVESNDSFNTYKITSYHLIERNFKNKDNICYNLSKWLELPEEKINTDKYELFYWASIENNDISYFSNDLKKYMEIESLFSYVKLTINAQIYDNVDAAWDDEINLNFENNKVGIGFKCVNCSYEVVNKVDEINLISWGEISDWKNYNNKENLLYAEINGSGIFKISKYRFKRATGIDLTSKNSGSLNQTALNALGFNLPDIKPYNRFQYWLRTTKF